MQRSPGYQSKYEYRMLDPERKSCGPRVLMVPIGVQPPSNLVGRGGDRIARKNYTMPQSVTAVQTHSNRIRTLFTLINNLVKTETYKRNSLLVHIRRVQEKFLKRLFVGPFKRVLFRARLHHKIVQRYKSLNFVVLCSLDLTK